jgi:MarR family 2-MHQ and catechol resistance regulon transcriptional repressor
MIGSGSEIEAAQEAERNESEHGGRPSPPAELRLWVALARAYQTLAKAAAADLTKHGLTTSQFSVMEALLHLGPMALGELADKLLVTGGNITYVVDRLEDQGFVRRDRSDQDRRIVVASLTPRGRRRVEGVYPLHAAYMEELVASLASDEVADVRRHLKKLGKAVAARMEASATT